MASFLGLYIILLHIRLYKLRQQKEQFIGIINSYVLATFNSFCSVGVFQFAEVLEQ